LIRRIEAICGTHSDTYPLKGTVRFLYNDSAAAAATAPPWLTQEAYAYDRTITEWHQLIEKYKEPIRGFVGNTEDRTNPFLYRPDAGFYLEALFRQQMRMRALARKWIAAVRCRIMRRRRIGDVDLYTLDPVPESSRVYVYDYRSKSQYIFHTQTILKTFLNALTYSAFGITYPLVPKNPYTNITWTLGQIVTIVAQIQTNLWRSAHRMIPKYLYAYRQAQYDMDQFGRLVHAQLEIDAAMAFFANAADSDVMFMEILEDLFAQASVRLDARMRRTIGERELSAAFNARWTEMVVRAWIAENYHYRDPALISDVRLLIAEMRRDSVDQ
jgi:hypothetical protein